MPAGFSMANFSKVKRLRIYQRDSFTCAYCGEKIQNLSNLHLEHIHPKSKGGKSNDDNLTTSCISCNLYKYNLTSQEFLLKAIDKYLEHKQMADYFLKITTNLKKKLSA